MLTRPSGDSKLDLTVAALFFATLLISLMSFYRGWPTHLISPASMLVGLVIFRAIMGPIGRTKLIVFGVIVGIYTAFLFAVR